MKRFVTYFLPLTLICLCGCEQKEHQPPPVERISLAVRFFTSMENQDAATAVIQGRNILARDTSQNHVLTLVSIQESNHAIANAQRKLNEGKIARVPHRCAQDPARPCEQCSALDIIENALLNYPDNNILKNTRYKLLELLHAESYFREMDRATSSAAITEARETIESGLFRNMTPQLTAYLNFCREREQLLAARERAASQAAREAASRDAAAAAADDERRSEEDSRHSDATAAEGQESQRMRDAAGPVPFEDQLEAASDAADKAKAEDARREAEAVRFLQQNSSGNDGE